MTCDCNASESDVQLPNPFTPMAFLSPELAFEVTIAGYIAISVCAILIWDILDNLKKDFSMITKFRFTHVPAAYIISRLSSLALLLVGVVFQTAPVHNCAQLGGKVIVWLYTIAMSSTSLLFFFRVKAIYDNNKYITTFFMLIWLAIFVGCIVATQGAVTGAPIGRTKYCLIVGDHVIRSSALVILPFVNDTLVFFAISWRLMRVSSDEGILKINMQTLRTMFLGDTMSRFMRTLLQDGQVYYLTTVCTNLLLVAITFSNATSGVIKTALSYPHIVLMNIMACRVFRKTRMDAFNAVSTTAPTMKFRLPFSFSAENSSSIAAEYNSGSSKNKEDSDQAIS